MLVSNMGATSKGNGTEQVRQEPVRVKIIPKKDDENIEESKNKMEGKIIVKKKKKHKQKKIECKYYYEGIGITIDGREYDGCRVTGVFEGYSAYKNDVRVGDLIIGNCFEIKGPEGTIINLTIMRGSSVIRKSLSREKICEEGNARRVP